MCLTSTTRIITHVVCPKRKHDEEIVASFAITFLRLTNNNSVKCNRLLDKTLSSKLSLLLGQTYNFTRTPICP